MSFDRLKKFLHGGVDRDAVKEQSYAHQEQYGYDAPEQPGLRSDGFYHLQKFIDGGTDQDEVRRSADEHAKSVGAYDQEPEKGLEDEGFADLFRPYKDVAIEKASEYGLPTWLTMGADLLTPDGPDIIGPAIRAVKGAGKLDMVSKDKYKPSRYSKIEPDPEFENKGIKDYVGNHHYHDLRAAQMAGDTPTPWDGELAGLKHFVEKNKEKTTVPLQRSDNLTKEELLDILQNDELVSPRMLSATDAKGGAKAGGFITNRANVKYRIHPGSDATDATRINPGEREWLIPEGNEYLVTNRDFDGEQFVFDLHPASKKGKRFVHKETKEADWSPYTDELTAARKKFKDDIPEIPEGASDEVMQKAFAEKKRLEKDLKDFYEQFTNETGVGVTSEGHVMDVPYIAETIKTPMKIAPAGRREKYPVNLRESDGSIIEGLDRKHGKASNDLPDNLDLGYEELAEYLGEKSGVAKSRNEDISKVKRWQQKHDENIKDAAQYGIKIPDGPSYKRAELVMNDLWKSEGIDSGLSKTKNRLIEELSDKNGGGFSVSQAKSMKDMELKNVKLLQDAFKDLEGILGDRMYRLPELDQMAFNLLKRRSTVSKDLKVELNLAGLLDYIPSEDWTRIEKKIKDSEENIYDLSSFFLKEE